MSSLATLYPQHLATLQQRLEAALAAQGFDALFVTSGIHRDALHPSGGADDWSVDEAAYRNLLAEAGAAPAAHLRELMW